MMRCGSSKLSKPMILNMLQPITSLDSCIKSWARRMKPRRRFGQGSLQQPKLETSTRAASWKLHWKDFFSQKNAQKTQNIFCEFCALLWLISFLQSINELFLFCRDLLFGPTPGDRVFICIYQHEGCNERKLLFDEAILFLLDEPVIGMALRYGPQLRLPEQLPEVLPLIKAHPVRE